MHGQMKETQGSNTETEKKSSGPSKPLGDYIDFEEVK